LQHAHSSIQHSIAVGVACQSSHAAVDVADVAFRKVSDLLALADVGPGGDLPVVPSIKPLARVRRSIVYMTISNYTLREGDLAVALLFWELGGGRDVMVG